MIRSLPSRLLCAGLLLWACALPRASSAPTGINREQQVKAAYLYNFARFTTWAPNKFATPDEPVRFCLLQGDPLVPAIHEALDGKAIEARPAQVVELQDAQEMRDCHVAYLGRQPALQLASELLELRDAGVLTVYEGSPGLEAGVVRLFIEDSRLRFEINLAAAERSHITLSARLLAVAKVLRE